MRLNHQASRPVSRSDKTMSGLRQRMNSLLFDVHSSGGIKLNLAIMALIFLSVFISMVGTLDSLGKGWVELIQFTELWVTTIFTVEFFARCYSARSLRAYLFSFYGVVDLLAILPMLLIGDPNIAIRVLRVFRLLKLIRYLRALRLFISSMRDVLEILSVVVGGIALGAILAGNVIYALEPETFSSAFDGAWWGIVTMTTVGYGDVVPHTLAGRVIAICLMVVGICLFAAVTATISVKIARALHHGVTCRSCKASIAPEFLYCPHCATRQEKEYHDSDHPQGVE